MTAMIFNQISTPEKNRTWVETNTKMILSVLKKIANGKKTPAEIGETDYILARIKEATGFIKRDEKDAENSNRGRPKKPWILTDKGQNFLVAQGADKVSPGTKAKVKKALTPEQRERRNAQARARRAAKKKVA